ncbi:helix-turn-helix transcriptional regulator [Sphingomonas sp.]|uniref:helix-turn-helix transcriptional regulator n=1 Tax=Sphingomonas sp. TaxID=28214 RepID=UPI002CBA84C2|nr:AlpA family phage regulatory protein [Sphingomonas sp.]HWK35163.1 AlpA family phage regulatory protein [Sphingomonas sp.]
MQNPLVIDTDGLRCRCGIRVARSTLHAWEKKGLFPRRFRIGQKVYWNLREVEEHLARLAKEARR